MGPLPPEVHLVTFMSAGRLTIGPCPRSVSQQTSNPPATSRRPSRQLTEGVLGGEPHLTLLGATGTGKTFTVAHVVEAVQRPTLVIAPNKSLGAQLANEFREVFPDNAVEYFVSYYDYYQPEAYIPTDGHLHREGLVGERRDRAPAPRRHRGAAVAPRRPHRGQRLVHLRAGFARGVPGPDPPPLQGDGHPARVRDAAPRRHPVQAEPGQPRARARSASPATPSRSSRRTTRSVPDRVVGRHDPAGHAVRPAHRRDRGGAHRDHGVPGVALRGGRRAHEARARDDRGGAAQRLGRAGRSGQAARGRAAAHAHRVRPGDDARGRVLQRYRELLAPHRRPRAEAPRRTRCSTTSPTTTSW